MEIDKLLQQLKLACSQPHPSVTEVKGAIERVLVWLTEPIHNTDENCRKVDNYVWIEVYINNRGKFPRDLERILFDMGGQLHDTHTAPEVAENFESTPQQLLDRVRSLITE